MQLKYQKPLSIRSWDDIQKYIILGKTHESIILDFKKEIPLKNPNSAKETARDIAQFANTWEGAFLLEWKKLSLRRGIRSRVSFVVLKTPNL